MGQGKLPEVMLNKADQASRPGTVAEITYRLGSCNS